MRQHANLHRTARSNVLSASVASSSPLSPQHPMSGSEHLVSGSIADGLDLLARSPSNDQILGSTLRLRHTLFNSTAKGPVFSLGVFEDASFLASAAGPNIDVWDLRYWSECPERRLEGHTRAVTALVVEASAGRLHSAARDGIKTWNLATRKCERTRSGHRGAIYCLAVCGGQLFAGSQDCCIHVYAPDADTPATTIKKLHGHSGFVYSLCPVGPDTLYSGGGDAAVLCWHRASNSGTWQVSSRLLGHSGAVMSLACDARHLYSASRDKSLRIWALGSHMPIRTLPCGHELLSCAITTNAVYCTTAASAVVAWQSPSWVPLGTVCSVEAPLVSLVAEGNVLYAGSESGVVIALQESGELLEDASPQRGLAPATRDETTMNLLAQWVALRSVSGPKGFRNECWKAAEWLQEAALAMGMDARMEVPNPDSTTNPIVYIRVGQDPSRKVVTIYGHYDVVHVEQNGWKTDPWALTGTDGFLYGRGATDDKGPMLAALVALAGLGDAELHHNVRFVIEGEEESGSRGTLESVERNMSWIGPTDVLIVSNNYWLDSERPCLVYGLRGVIHFDITVSGPLRSNHSGVDGGAYREPLMDLLHVLSSLTDSATGRVLVDGFYDNVRPLSVAEEELYKDISFDVKRYAAKAGLEGLLLNEDPTTLLRQRWREPSMSVTGVETPSAGNPTVLPRQASARMSIRTVPDQRPSALVDAVQHHLSAAFAKIGSRNKLAVTVLSRGDYWLGDVNAPHFQWTAKAIEHVWEQRPLFTREGGTIPILRNLERLLACKALILPLSQDGDGAHLANERISITNLLKGVQVFRRLYTTPL